VTKIITIRSVGSSPHIREIYGYEECLPVFFFILRQAYRPNKKSNLDHNASIDADFLKEVPFGGLDNCKDNFRVIFAPKN
jgi:hypothetical protein